MLNLLHVLIRVCPSQRGYRHQLALISLVPYHFILPNGFSVSAETKTLFAMAGFTVFRFFRFLRSMCAPITACIGFSCLLSFIFILYQPNDGPGNIQKLGWQSWDLITMTKTKVADVSGSQTGAKVPEGVEWWNVSEIGQNAVDTASLPLDVWSPLLPHDTGCG